MFASSKTAAVASAANYIEDVFSTYLYTGNGSTQTITNGIDLAGKGGMLWLKSRSTATDNTLYDTARGASNFLFSNGTSGNQSPSELTSFNSNGFSLSYDSLIQETNNSGTTYVSWAFRKQSKFFDVVTYTGNGANRTINHNLGAVPGCIMVKRTNTSSDWQVYHRSLANTQYIVLNTNAAALTGATRWNSTTPTSTVFSLGTDATVNANGATYVAYIFAHDAGGFGLTGTDNVISCGSYTGNGTGGDNGGTIVTLGYEPQWVLIKNYSASNTNSWVMMDTMRGLQYGNDSPLWADLSDAEQVAQGNYITPLATGFQLSSTSGGVNNLNKNFIYIAIRRGPMKVPTSGTSVFSPNASTGTSSTRTITTNFPVDFQLANPRTGSSWPVRDRLRGGGVGTTKQLTTTTTDAETTLSASFGIYFDNNTGIGLYQNTTNASGTNYIYYHFQRAPSFFDEVCYTGTGANRNLSHNLQAVPELIICKTRSGVDNWAVYSASTGATKFLILNLNFQAITESTVWNNTSPTSTQFTVGTNTNSNGSGNTYVAYPFATCAGVSKVGSYTGNGSTQTINCGFTGGARFVLIKRTDSTGDWYVYDTARGMTTLTDPYLLLNSTAAESATLGSVTTVSTGFAVNASILAAINTNTASYIFLAIA